MVKLKKSELKVCLSIIIMFVVIGTIIVGWQVSMNHLSVLAVLVVLVSIGITSILIMVLGMFTRKFTDALGELSDKTASLDILKSVLNGMDIFLYVTDPETNEILFVNKALIEHFDLTNNVIGEFCWKVFQTGMDERCGYCSLEKCRSNPDKSIEWEAYNTIAGRYYRNIDRIIDWPNGKKVHFCQRIDTTEKKQTEDMLLKMSSIVKSSPNFVSYKKLTGECIFVNPAASILTGYSGDELLENYIGVLFDEESADYIKNVIYPAIRDEGLKNYEIPVKRKDGEIRIFSVCSFLVESDEKAFGTVANDITEKRKLENELIYAKEAAESASQAKNDFLSRMSHEMKTPMNAIIGMINLAQKADNADEAKKHLDKASVAANHLLAIINDMLDMSIFELGKVEFQESEFILQDLLNRIITDMQFKFDENEQNFCVQVDEDVPKLVVSDKRRLTQVIENLLSNASKFTPKDGNISLNVKRMSSHDNICKLLIEVEDDGVGITQEQREHLFELFEQADNTISRSFGGVGLGLAISKAIVDMMDGEIWVESVHGEGAKFNFIVDICVTDSADADYTETTFSGTNNIANLFKNSHILLVDDIEINRNLFYALIEETGVVIEYAENGLEACNKFAKNPEIYDLIFMDIHMPEMDGYEASKTIRKMDVGRAKIVPIIAVTADSLKEEIFHCGMNDYIGKPLEADIIIEKMKKYILGNQCRQLNAKLA